jgi:hypothetical protein
MAALDFIVPAEVFILTPSRANLFRLIYLKKALCGILFPSFLGIILNNTFSDSAKNFNRHLTAR